MNRILLPAGVLLILGSACSAHQARTPGGGAAGGMLHTAEAAPSPTQTLGGPKDTRGQGGDRAAGPWSKRMVIKTAELTLISDDLEDGFAKAARLAKQLGGYTRDSHRTDESVSVTLRIPADRFEEAVRRLTKLGEIERRQIGGEDITAQFVDLSMRLQNKVRMRQRYLKLLERAANVSEAVKIQRELERITGEIESLRGKINMIQSRVGMSTINLTLETPTRPGPVGWIFYGLYKGVYWLFVWD